jgi:hypothetical protein
MGETTVLARPGSWTEAELPGGPTLHPVMVSAGWVGERELRCDIVYVTTPHRLVLRGVIDANPRYQATWIQAPL